MKLRLMFAAVMFALCGSAFAQADTLKVYVNNKLAGKEMVRGEAKTITVKEKRYMTIKKLAISMNGGSARNGVFKRALEMEAGGDTAIMHINETAGKPGWFAVNLTRLRAIVKNNKELKLFYLEDPKNPRMMVRSMRKHVATVRFE